MCQYIFNPYSGRLELVGYCHVYLMYRDWCTEREIVDTAYHDGVSSYRRLGPDGREKKRSGWRYSLKKFFEAAFDPIRYRYRSLKWEYDDYQREKKREKNLREGRWVEYRDRYGVIQVCEA